MRNFKRYLVPGLLLAMLLCNSAMGQGRVATIDMRKVFDNYWRTKQARLAIDEDKAEKEKDHTTMVNEWKKLKEDYQAAQTGASDQAISAEEREKRQKLAEDKLKKVKEAEESLVSYEKTARSTYEERIRRMHDNILEEIRNVLSAKAKAANYAVVLDTAGDSVNGIPVVLFSSGENDITASLLEQLNAAAPTEVKPDAKPADKKKDEKSK